MSEHDSFRQIPVEIADKLIGLGSFLILFFGPMRDVSEWLRRFL